MSKTFIITGGHSLNKGAQAMMFAVVQELKTKKPGCEIWVFSNENEENNMYQFNLLTWDRWMVIRLLLGRLKVLTKPSVNFKNEDIVKNVIKKADAIFDISGFTLTSQFGFGSSITYLLKIALAKKNKCKVYLLPQSFGPFIYPKLIHKLTLHYMMKKYLSYPEMIFPRETQGLNDLKAFTQNNLYKSLDIVLLTKKPQSSLIYKQSNYNEDTNVIKEGKSVAIIPNTKILKWNSENDIYLIYERILKILADSNYHTYIVRHANEDLEFCQNIAKQAEDSSRVEVLVEDYCCIDLHEILSQMDFVIASRYHSLIHAYKSNIPAIVIGWAEKYPEVMREFEQHCFYFDIREKIEIKLLESKLKDILYNCSKYSALIDSKMDIRQEQYSNLSHLFENV